MTEDAMIPKKIHYCWFSGDPYPEKVLQCINSWKKYMPDWEYVLWDMEMVKAIDSIWLKECLNERQWAFAADFVRLYALYSQGGVYLDTDCEVYKDFSDLLSCRSFIGRENCIRFVGFNKHYFLTSHCMGAHPHDSFMHRCLHYFDDRHFIRSNDRTLPINLRYDRMILPQIQYELAMEIGYNPDAMDNSLQVLENGLEVFSYQYFDANSAKEGYCKHWAVGNWMSVPEQRKGSSFKFTWRYWVRFHIFKYTHKWWRKHYFIFEMME